LAINSQCIIGQPNMAVYGLNRINRRQAGLKNLKGLLPHLLNNRFMCIHIPSHSNINDVDSRLASDS
jgi:hypothetical protein